MRKTTESVMGGRGNTLVGVGEMTSEEGKGDPDKVTACTK